MPRLGTPFGTHGSAVRGLLQGPSYDPDAAAYVLAALYCRDALNGRLDNGHAAMWHRPPWVRRLFILHTSSFWSLFVFGCCTMHVLLFFGEPSITLPATLHAAGWSSDSFGWATSLSGASVNSAHTLVLFLEIFCTAALITDAGIKMTFIGFHKWRRRPTHRIYAFLIGALVLDTLLFLSGAGRPLRCLRCGVMLVRSRTLRKNVAAILAIWKVLALCTLILLLLLLVCASTAVHLFSSSYLPSALPPPPPPLPSMPGAAFGPEPGLNEATLHSSSFYSLAWGLSAAFQLLTTENYPDVAYMPVAAAPAAMAFFIVWWYLISFIVLAIVTAVIVDSYWTVSKSQIFSEGRREKLGLMRAFELLHKRRGHFGMRVWERFLKELMPGASVTEARVRFAMMDLDQNGQVDALEFLQIRSQLEMQLHELPHSGPNLHHAPSRGSWLNPAAAGAPPRRLCRYALSAAAGVDARRYTMADTAAAAGQFVLLIVVHPETGPSRAKALSDASLALAFCTAAILAVRAALHAHVSTWKTFLQDWSHSADTTVVALAFACYTAIYATHLPGLHPTTNFSPFDWSFVPELLLAVRLAWVTPYTKRFLPLVLRIVPILWWITVLILLVMSFFAVVGMELFGICEQADPDLQPNADLYAGHASFFAHFQLSLLTNVQLLVTNDWHRVMYATQTAACPPGGTTRAVVTQVYFIGVYVAYQIVLYPVLIALATNAYMHFSAVSHSEAHAPTAARSASSVRVEFLKRETPRDSRVGFGAAAAGRLSSRIRAGLRPRASRVGEGGGGAKGAGDGLCGRGGGEGWRESCGNDKGTPPTVEADAAGARRCFAQGEGAIGLGSNSSLSSLSRVAPLDRRSCVGARVVQVLNPSPPAQSLRTFSSLSWLGRLSSSPDARRTRGSLCSVKSRKSAEAIPGGGAASEPHSPESHFGGRTASVASMDASSRAGASSPSFAGRSTSSITEGDEALFSDAGRGSVSGGRCGGARQAPNGAAEEALRGVEWEGGEQIPGGGRSVPQGGAPARRASFSQTTTSFPPTRDTGGGGGGPSSPTPGPSPPRSPRCSASPAPGRGSRVSKASSSSAGNGERDGGAGGGGGNMNSCFYVHMLKTKHYRAGGWRRDLMRNEMGDTGPAELNDLSAEAQISLAQMVQQWEQRRIAHTPSIRTDIQSRWGRTAKWVSGGAPALAPAPAGRPPEVGAPPEVGPSPEIGQPLVRVSDVSSISGSLLSRDASLGGSPTRCSVGGSPHGRGKDGAAQRDEIRRLLRASQGRSAVVGPPAVSTSPPAAGGGGAPGHEEDAGGVRSGPPLIEPHAHGAEEQAVHTDQPGCEDRCKGPRGASVARCDTFATGAGAAAGAAEGADALSVSTPFLGSAGEGLLGGGGEGESGKAGGPRRSPRPGTNPAAGPHSRDAQRPPFSRSSHAHGSGGPANSSRGGSHSGLCRGSNSGLCSGSNSGLFNGSNSGFFRFPGLEEAVAAAQRSAAKPGAVGHPPAAWPTGGGGEAEAEAASTRSGSSSAAGGGGGGVRADGNYACAPPRPQRSGTGSSVGPGVGALRKLASVLFRPMAAHADTEGEACSRTALHADTRGGAGSRAAPHADTQGGRGFRGAPNGAVEIQGPGRGHGTREGAPPSAGGSGAAGGGLGGGGGGRGASSPASQLWDRLRSMTRDEREAVFAAEMSLGGAAWDDLVATYEQAEMAGRFMQAHNPGRESVVLFNDLTDETRVTAGVQDGQMLVVPHFLYHDDEDEEEGEEGGAGGWGYGGSAGVLAARPSAFPASPSHRKAPTLVVAAQKKDSVLAQSKAGGGREGGSTAAGGGGSPAAPKRGLLRGPQLGLRRAQPHASRSPKVAPACEPNRDAGE